MKKKKKEKTCKTCADNWWNPICYEQNEPCKFYIQKKNEDLIMATIKSYTDISQSKKLAEILTLESADMYYSHEFVNSAGDYYKINIPSNEYFDDDEEPGSDIPCWSLAALLSILPNKIVSHETAFEGEDAKGITDIYYKCIESTEDDRYMFRYLGNGYEYKCVADNPVDVCYEMILKLHEFKML